MKNIIFLMGLPRSGTTLLQRVLASHPEIASVAEPWVLLPLLACFDERITASAYGHQFLKQALTDFRLELPEFQSKYDEHVRLFISKIYGDLSGNKKYFLDKTPRYFLIAEDLHRVFPESKFVYLLRNPLDVFDSVIETFCSNRLYQVAFCYVDLMHGLNLLCAPIIRGKRNIHLVTYESFCAEGEKVLQEICNHLEIAFKPEMLNDFTKVNFAGKSGDPKQDRASCIVQNKRQKALSIVRRFLYKRWVNNIKTESWDASGYSKSEILSELSRRPMAGLWRQLDDVTGFIVFNIVLFMGYKLSARFKKRYAGLSDLDVFLH